MPGRWFQHQDRNWRIDSGCVGLVAGWGRFPVEVAKALKAQGQRVVCVGALDHADPELEEVCDGFRWAALGQIGMAIRYFRAQGAREATMAGKIFKVKLFDRYRWLKYLPDWTTVRMMLRLIRHGDLKDDTILSAICDLFDQQGVRMVPATDFAPELLVQGGALTRRRPTQAQWRDIQRGWQLAKELGRLDVGQSVAIREGAVLALEAIEGTDAAIARAGGLCRQGGFTVVKVAKPNQDMRFDVPTIGIGTLETMVQAGGKVLAIEAGRTILLEQADFVRYADRHGLVIVAIEAQGQSLPTACELGEAQSH